MSVEELYLFSESENDESGYGYPGKSVGSSGDVGFVYFVPTGIESIGDVVLLVVFVPRGVQSKVG